MGQLISVVLWAGSGALAVSGSARIAILFLLVADVFAYSMTQAGLCLPGCLGKVSTRRIWLSKDAVSFRVASGRRLENLKIRYSSRWVAAHRRRL